MRTAARRSLLVFAILVATSGCAAARKPPRPAMTAEQRRMVERLARDPDDVDARLGLAAARRSAGDLEGALVEVHKALVSDPRSAAAHAERARIYYERGLLEKEIDAWRAALSMDERHDGARENLGHALVAAGRHAEAAVEYRRVLDANPDALPVLFNLAMLEMDAGHAESARDLWTRYLDKDPDSPWSQKARTALDTLARKGTP